MEEKKVKTAGYRAGEIFAWVMICCFSAVVITGTAAMCYRVWQWIL